MKYKIDKYLDEYARTVIPPGSKKYHWWWNANDILSDAIASACRHVRKDGCHLLSDQERYELATLERYMRAFNTEAMDDISINQETWLHAEAMSLLSQWFTRLWD